MDEEIQEICSQSFKFFRIQLEIQAAEAIDFLFSNNTHLSFNLNFDHISPQLSHNQRLLLSRLYNQANILCFTNEFKDLNERNKISDFLQTSLLNFQSHLNIPPAKLVVIMREVTQSTYFYFGFLYSRQKIFTQAKNQICSNLESQETLNSFPMNCDGLYQYVKQKVGKSSLHTSGYDQSKVQLQLEHQLQKSPFEGSFDQFVQNIICSRPKLQKKNSGRNQQKKSIYIRPPNFLPPNSDASNLRQYLNLIDKKVQIPKPLLKLLDNIPHQHSQYLLQGLLKKITKMNKFSTYFHKFIDEVALNPKRQQSKLFNKDALEQNPISSFPLPAFSLGSFHDIEEFFPSQPLENISFLESFQTSTQNSQNNENNIILQNLQEQREDIHFFNLDKEALSEEAKILNQKIKNLLQSKFLKLRSTGEIAKKFLQAKRNGTITLQTRPEQLIKMRMNVGKNYCEILHPLFMEQLKMQTNNYSATFLKTSIETSIKKIKSAISINDQELPFENQIHSILSSVQLKQFCQLINKDKTISLCKVVHIQLDNNTIIQTLTKYTHKGGCSYFKIQDFHHVYDGQFIFPLQAEMTPERLIELLVRNKREDGHTAGVHLQPMSVESMSSLIQSSMIIRSNDYMTVFFQQTSFGKKLLIMIKIKVFERSNEFFTFKMSFKVFSNTGKYDLLEAYTLRILEQDDQ